LVKKGQQKFQIQNWISPVLIEFENWALHHLTGNIPSFQMNCNSNKFLTPKQLKTKPFGSNFTKLVINAENSFANVL